MRNMTAPELEETFAAISAALNEVAAAERVTFLAKLALLLANEQGDPQRVRELVARAKQDLELPPSAR
jgi:hypothetical protein